MVGATKARAPSISFGCTAVLDVMECSVSSHGSSNDELTFGQSEMPPDAS